jgi:predicted ArsR family transcriptional regulator
MLEHREQGYTRQEILNLLRRRGQMTAAELSESLGIGAVGVRQHIALLERDGLVHTAAVRRGVGRPSHLYALTPAAEALFPRRYDRLLMDALEFISEQGGPAAIDSFFARRRHKLAEQYAPRLAGKQRGAQVAELAEILTEQGYMAEWHDLPGGGFALVEHNCPVDCAARAHDVGVLVLADGAQSAPHMPVDVQALGVDFFAFSGHKLCGPTGVGALWGRRAVLEAMPPFLGGGSMIKTVTLHETTYADIPARFEAGTPAIGEAIALGEAVDFLSGIGMDNIFAHEQHLLGYALERLSEVEGLQIYGPLAVEGRGAALSFTLEGVHPHDVAAILDGEGVAVRAGHHCCQPLHTLLDIPATTRASFYLYNIPEEVDRLVAGLDKARKLFA